MTNKEAKQIARQIMSEQGKVDGRKKISMTDATSLIKVGMFDKEKLFIKTNQRSGHLEELPEDIQKFVEETKREIKEVNKRLADYRIGIYIHDKSKH